MWSLPTTVFGLLTLITVTLASTVAYLYRELMKVQAGKEEILREMLQSDNVKFNTLQEALTLTKELRKK